MSAHQNQPITRSIAFMRMSAIQLRRIAERAPEVADELRHMANQLDLDADDLERHAPGRSG